MKIVLITLGGSRQEAMESMLQHPDIEVILSPGVPSRDLRNRKKLMAALYKSRVLIKDPSLGPNMAQVGIWGDVDYAQEFWKKGRSINRERAVLGCLLAHLDAMKLAVEVGADCILEDNSRTLMNLDAVVDTIRKFRNCSAAGGESKVGVRYYGYLGPKDNLTWLYNTHIPKYPGDVSNPVPFPMNEHYDENISGTSLWGAYAYMPTKRGYEAVVSKLQSDLGAILWKSKKMLNYKVKPIDKIVPRRIKEAGLDVLICRNPIFFRAPMLGSRIHRKWDAAFCESTGVQLQACGVEWEGLWGTNDEKNAVEEFRKTGQWRHQDGKDVHGVPIENARGGSWLPRWESFKIPTAIAFAAILSTAAITYLRSSRRFSRAR